MTQLRWASTSPAGSPDERIVYKDCPECKATTAADAAHCPECNADFGLRPAVLSQLSVVAKEAKAQPRQERAKGSTGSFLDRWMMLVGALVALLCIQLTLQLVLGSDVLFSVCRIGVALTTLFFVNWGVFRRQRLAWQWGRLCIMLGIVMAVLAFIVSVLLIILQGPTYVFNMATWLLLGFQIVPIALGIAVYTLFGSDRALAYFKLLCPECKSPGVPADFYFRSAKCKSCDCVW